MRGDACALLEGETRAVQFVERLQWQFSQMGLLPDVCVIRILG